VDFFLQRRENRKRGLLTKAGAKCYTKYKYSLERASKSGGEELSLSLSLVFRERERDRVESTAPHRTSRHGAGGGEKNHGKRSVALDRLRITVCNKVFRFSGGSMFRTLNTNFYQTY
jgi:hypothetical protein